MVKEPGKPRRLTTSERIALTSLLALAGALTPAETSLVESVGSARGRRPRVARARLSTASVLTSSVVQPEGSACGDTALAFGPTSWVTRTSWRSRPDTVRHLSSRP